MIQHTLIVNYRHYICPLSSTTTSLSIYINTKSNICHIMFRKKVTGAFKGMRRIKLCCNILIAKPEKCLFRNTQLLQYLHMVGTHVKQGGNNYQSCIVAGIKNILQENNKHFTLSVSTNQIESNWWLPLFT